MTKAMEDSKKEYQPPGQPNNVGSYPDVGINHAEPSRTESEIAPDKGNGDNGQNFQVL